MVIGTAAPLGAQQAALASEKTSSISTEELASEITDFLGREVTAHVADLRTLNPPQDRVLGALTHGEFTWGTFMGALGSYYELVGQRTVAGRDIAKIIGQMGLIEAKGGGKSFAQMYAAMALRAFGTDLGSNPVWQSLTAEEREAWRSLLDPGRFYDRRTRRVINLPENYLGVAARVVTMDYQLGIIDDRSFSDDILNRAAQQFTDGRLYSDDAPPSGRFDRYSNEYARYVYLAAENVNRVDMMRALGPTLKTQMRTWWDLLSPDGYGYPWGRSLGAISYMDTMEIVAFLAQHPKFRPAPLPQLASAYYAAWKWLRNDYQSDRHLLNVFGFGRGNYSYIAPEREWQQTSAFFGKVAGANAKFSQAMQRERIASFSRKLELPKVARFEFFWKGDRPAGVWLVRHSEISFALPITTGTRPGVSDYLSAPYALTCFAPPVEQSFPTVTPYLQLADGRTFVAGDGADQIEPAADGMALRAVWRRWAALGGKPGEVIDTGLTTEVVWRIEGSTLIRREATAASKPVTVRHFWVAVPSSCAGDSTSFNDGHRTDRFYSSEGGLQVSVIQSDWPLESTLKATGNSPLGRGSRGPVPLYLDFEARGVRLEPGKPLKWTLRLTPVAASSVGGAHD